MRKLVKCRASFIPVLFCNTKGEIIRVGSMWEVFHGTTVNGLDFHLEGTEHYSGKYMDIKKDDLHKYFISIR